MRSPKTERGSSRRVAATFLFFLGLYCLTQSGRFHVIDEYETFFVTESLLDRGTLDISQVGDSDYFFGKRDENGTPYAPYGVGQSILTLPFLAVGKLLDGLLPEPSPDPDFWLWFSSALSSAFFAAVAVACFQLWLLRRGLPESRAVFGAFLLGAGTLVWAYATQYRSNVAVMALFLGLLVTLEKRGLAWGLLRLCLAALVILVRLDAVLGVALLGLYSTAESLLRRRCLRALLDLVPLGIGAALGIATVLAINWLHFGSPLDSGYPAVDDLGRPAYRFGVPDAHAALALLFSPGKGLFFLCPVLFLAVTRLPVLLKERLREGLLVVGMAGVYLLLFSAWQHYEGGWCFGPRFLIPVVPFLLIPLVFCPLRVRWVVAALVIGITINVFAVSVNYLAIAHEGGYYVNLENPLEPMRYNVFHNPLPEHLARGLESWSRVLQGQVIDGDLGSGLDFWWAFALKESIPAATVVGLVVAQGLLLVAGIALLAWRRVRLPGGGDSSKSGPAGAGREEETLSVQSTSV